MIIMMFQGGGVGSTHSLALPRLQRAAKMGASQSAISGYNSPHLLAFGVIFGAWPTARARNLVRAALPRLPNNPFQLPASRLRSPPPPSPLLAGLWDAYGIGANDVANAFSTSVNSGVFTMAQVGVVVRGKAPGPSPHSPGPPSAVRGGARSAAPCTRPPYRLPLPPPFASPSPPRTQAVVSE